MIPFTVEFVRGQPVFLQVMEAAKRAMLSGQLKAGDTFPALHQLVQDLRIHPSSARRAISELQKEGWLTSGDAYTLKVAPLNAELVAQRSRMLRAPAASLVREAQRLGVGRDEVVRLIGEIW